MNKPYAHIIPTLPETVKDLTFAIGTMHEAFVTENFASGRGAPYLLKNSQDYITGCLLRDFVEAVDPGCASWVMKDVADGYEPMMKSRFRSIETAHSDTYFMRLVLMVDTFNQDEVRDDINAWVYQDAIFKGLGRDFCRYFATVAIAKELSKETGKALLTAYATALESLPIPDARVAEYERSVALATADLQAAGVREHDAELRLSEARREREQAADHLRREREHLNALPRVRAPEEVALEQFSAQLDALNAPVALKAMQG